MGERQSIPITFPRELTLGPDDFTDLPTEIHKLVNNGAEQQAVSAIADFIGDLFQIPTVDGVVFSQIRESPAPTTLSFGVLLKLDHGTPQATDSILTVGAAEAKLTRRLYGFLPTSLVYINTYGTDIPTIKEWLLKNSQKDLGLPVLLVVFRRD